MQDILESSGKVSQKMRTGFPTLYYENYTFYAIDSQQLSDKDGISGRDTNSRDCEPFSVRANQDMLNKDLTHVNSCKPIDSTWKTCLAPVYEGTPDGSRICSGSESIPNVYSWYRSSALDRMVSDISQRLLDAIQLLRMGLAWANERYGREQNEERLPLLPQHNGESYPFAQQNRTKKALYYLPIVIGLLMLLAVYISSNNK
ncbi:unnamed protein product [Cyberlindnera jadinii]|uniref:Uncharacterized protein n=1 Tax=Cyberlindnera jadinii (strain ATCC 18201 / CBS 1600 / BCRC 20928 / JCM 3617 / NBRC 0987 / NRRL Y-1542) TaxID=983966 RepID=A0A0H5BZC4_CYBJN|nr:unnamed protein product [Cyberlindnera jadinii]